MRSLHLLKKKIGKDLILIKLIHIEIRLILQFYDRKVIYSKQKALDTRVKMAQKFKF